MPRGYTRPVKVVLDELDKKEAFHKAQIKLLEDKATAYRQGIDQKIARHRQSLADVAVRKQRILQPQVQAELNTLLVAALAAGLSPADMSVKLGLKLALPQQTQ